MNIICFLKGHKKRELTNKGVLHAFSCDRCFDYISFGIDIKARGDPCG